MIARLRCLVTHHRTYRERRPLAGVSVLHFVCERCGRAWPMMRRTPDEYREAARSQLRPLRVYRELDATQFMAFVDNAHLALESIGALPKAGTR